MPGVSMFVMRRYFQHVLAVGRAQQVILAVDFLQFNAADAPDEAGFERLAVTADGRPTSKIRLWWPTDSARKKTHAKTTARNVAACPETLHPRPLHGRPDHSASAETA
jgi:hypothetical protein